MEGSKDTTRVIGKESVWGTGSSLGGGGTGLTWNQNLEPSPCVWVEAHYVTVLKCCANIYFNRQCLRKKVIPKYANIIIIIINNNNIISVMELGHLLTRSCLTYPEVSSKVYHDSFCQSGSSVSLPWVIYFEAFYLHVVSSFSCIPVICPKLVLILAPLQFMHLFCNLSQLYPAVLLVYSDTSANEWSC